MRRRGTFRFDPPAAVPGGTIEIPKTSWEECASCEEQIILPALRRALDEEALRRQGLLPASEIKSIRARAGLSQRKMSRRLGVGEKTYARWESGR
ncbi:MAG: helix-turn-helix domain-containing protein, partial [Planctomycetota bacterium]